MYVTGLIVFLSTKVVVVSKNNINVLELDNDIPEPRL